MKKSEPVVVECVACYKECTPAPGTKLCPRHHKVWKKLNHSRPSEGAKNKIIDEEGPEVFFRLVALTASQISARRIASASSGNLPGAS